MHQPGRVTASGVLALILAVLVAVLAIPARAAEEHAEHAKAAHAKAPPAKEAHPRRAEVTSRDRNLAKDMNKNYGDLSGHYNQLQRQDASIRQQTQKDMQKNGGYLTKAQQKQLNGEENKLKSEIAADKGPPPKTQFEQDHPRRAEVLHRDNRINGNLNADAGKLGGNLGSLQKQQQSIRQQEQADAAANRGHITKAEQQQLNTEETQLNQQIRKDLK
jgi:hypothetical protein